MYSHTHMYVFECIFSAKSFRLGNLSLLTDFQKLSAGSNTVSTAHTFLLQDMMLVLTKITYWRNGQLTRLVGHFE